MLSALNELAVSLTYPPLLSAVLILAGIVAAAIRWRRSGRLLVLLGCGWTLLWSIPQCADWLRASLERQYPRIDEAALPRADAIVVLGGGDYSWLHRAEVSIDDLDHSRLATGTRAWLAGRAPVIILSGGGGGKGPSEADTMAKAIARLGVPASALLLEERSHDTRDNARFSAQLARRHGIHRILLVTSALHMPRASYWFRSVGLDVVPVPVPESRIGGSWTSRWLPTRRALWRAGRAWTESPGLLAARVQTLAAGAEADVDAGRPAGGKT
jgi:uncharacterized SAM-binding protein YcdF (DUF218 family)